MYKKYGSLASMHENFTQQTQASANRNAQSKQWQPWLAACQRKRLRFLRFSFTHRTQRKRLRLNGNREIRISNHKSWLRQCQVPLLWILDTLLTQSTHLTRGWSDPCVSSVCDRLCRRCLTVLAVWQDGSTAMSVAMEAGNSDVGVLLYAHEERLKSASVICVNIC